jgi:uncharacterized protein YdhG (YjbR/CyaY superfamily)
MDSPKTIDKYIANFPAETREILEQIRTTIRKIVPEATEAMKYGIPTFVLNENLVHFAAYPNHIGFYPTPSAVKAFKGDLSKYKTSKGAIQFPVDEPMPLDLITKIVKFRVSQNLAEKQ